MVNANDFTYSKGYLGLLSALGASLGIIVCCVPFMPAIYHHLRPASPSREKTPVNVEEGNNETHDSAPIESPLRITEDSAVKTHGRSARLSMDGCAIESNPPPYGGLRRNHTF